jgi:hypothetical protein
VIKLHPYFSRPSRLLGLLIAIAIAPPQAFASPVQLDYELYYKGLRALTARFDLELGPKDYRISVDAETAGLVSVFVSWRNRSMSTGEVTDQGIEPRYHRQSGTWRGGTRSVTLSFDPQRQVAVEVEPPPKEDDRDPVPQELTMSTVDLLSAIVGVQHAVASGRGCTGSWPVFDGRRRYDVSVEEIGTVHMAADDRSSYAGQAVRCRATYTQLAGSSHEPEAPRRKLTALDLWLAPVGQSSHPVLVQMRAEGSFGVATLYLREITRAAPAVAEARTDLDRH